MFTQAMLKTARFAWFFIIVIIVIAAMIKQPVVDTSVMSLLPSSEQTPLVKAASEQMGKQFSQRLLILVSAKNESNNREKLQTAVADITLAFEQLPQIDSVIGQVGGEASHALQQSLFAYRYVLLTEQLRETLESGDTEALRQRALSQVINPISFGAVRLKDDPFGLFTAWQTSQTPAVNIVIDNGYMRVKSDEQTYLVIVNLRDDAFAMATQRAVMSQFEKLQSKLDERHILIKASGLLIHADAGAKQAQLEMSTIGLGSLLGIVLLMFWVFRRFFELLILLLPILTGCLVATSAAFLVFKQVHLVTFAFGAGLIGVAIDYALHYLCERRQRETVLARIMPGLFLGLISSVIAYAAQAITPFPGLRQMAVFSVIGLISAWLTVVLWFPWLTRNEPIESLPAAAKLVSWQARFPCLATSSWLLPALIVLSVMSIVVVFTGQAEDDIRLLQTSPPELVEQETGIQQLLGIESSTQFLLLPCQRVQTCLNRESLIKPALEQLKVQGELIDYQLVSDKVPALRKQQENVDLVEKLYKTELATLYQQLNLPENAKKQASESLHADLENRLTWLNASQLVPNAQSQVINDKQGIASIIRLTTHKKLSPQTFSDLQQSLPELILVDQVAAISDLMKSYREQIMFWVAMAYIVVFVILAMRYRIAVWRIVAPPLLASIFTLAVLMQCLPGINIFHMMALILVLGIGLDMGIFLLETQQSSHTWLAVTLSTCTSLLAFGLLALSDTPVLKHFGLTVLLGLSFVWILAILLRQTDTRST